VPALNGADDEGIDSWALLTAVVEGDGSVAPVNEVEVVAGPVELVVVATVVVVPAADPLFDDEPHPATSKLADPATTIATASPRHGRRVLCNSPSSSRSEGPILQARAGQVSHPGWPVRYSRPVLRQSPANPQPAPSLAPHTGPMSIAEFPSSSVATLETPSMDQADQGRDPAPPPHQRLARLLRGRPGDPPWVRPALLLLLLTTGFLYLWDLSASGWANSFYSAAVQAGTKSWKAFFFGSFDSSNFITVDKSPAALWVMELSARLFGVNSWSILVPNAFEGVVTVGVLYLTVRRWFSPAAGLLAGAVLALTPVAALMFRYNNPDAFLVLLLTLAAYATVRAVEAGQTRWIVLAGALVGFGFLAKMLQAFLVVPAFGLVYLMAAPGSLSRRVRQLSYAGAALVAAAGWWVMAVQLTPAADRPYIGGSQNNSLWNLIFGYNGFGRLTGNEAGSVGGGGTGTSRWGATGLTRLFGADMGSQISWLLPAALILLGAGLVLSGRRPRTDRTRAALVLWGGWLLVSGAAFSLGEGIIHPYYTVALAPAIGAIIGVGGTAVWARRHQLTGRILLASVVAVSAGWSWDLLQRSPTWMPELRSVVLLVGLAAAVGFLIWPWIDIWTRRAVVAVGLIAALAAPAAFTLDTVATPHSGAIPSAGPAVTTAAGFGPGGGPGRAGRFGGFGGSGRAGGAFARVGPGAGTGGFTGSPPNGAGTGGFTGSRPNGLGGTRSAGGAGGGFGGLLNASSPSATLVKYLEQSASRYKWMLSTVGANEAAGYQLSTRDAVMAIGGFNGTDPAPTLAQFEKMVAAGDIHYFIASGSGGLGGGFGGGGFAPSATGAGATAGGAGATGGAGSSGTATQITTWVEAHFPSTTVGGVTVYDLAGT
jgi:4-amino-4-deoxy-L-arabinose transferase-like glycosyltransferase